MKKVRRVPPMESSPSSSSYMTAGEEARARFKYQGLLQDYEELVKETDAKKKILQQIKQKKLGLLSVVKFLRRKYKSLLETPSQATPYRLKKQTRKLQASVRICRPPNAVVRSAVPTKHRNQRVMEGAAPSTSAVIDLNQISLPNGEEVEEFHVRSEPLKMEKLKWCSIDGDGADDDLKLSICGGVENNSNRVGKRKISWQDQVALRV